MAEDSGVKLRGSVYGSREPSGCPQRLLKMQEPVRSRLASLSDFQFGAVATETIEDALLHLAQQNERAVQGAAGRMGSFRETRIVGVDPGPGRWFCGRLGHLSGRHPSLEVLFAFFIQISVVSNHYMRGTGDTVMNKITPAPYP